MKSADDDRDQWSASTGQPTKELSCDHYIENKKSSRVHEPVVSKEAEI